MTDDEIVRDPIPEGDDKDPRGTRIVGSREPTVGGVAPSGDAPAEKAQAQDEPPARDHGSSRGPVEEE